MSVLSVAAVMMLAAQWGQPIAPKMIVAQATVESALDPLAIHDNTSGRTYHPMSQSEAIEIAARLDRAGSDFDAGLMQINRRNFGWLHLTIAEAFDPRHSIEAGAAVMVSMSRYNTGGLAGLRNGYVEKVLASTKQLGEPLSAADAPEQDIRAAAPSPPPEPFDLLHSDPASSDALIDELHSPSRSPDGSPVSEVSSHDLKEDQR